MSVSSQEANQSFDAHFAERVSQMDRYATKLETKNTIRTNYLSQQPVGSQQDQIHLPNSVVQQRQVLALMGIDLWTLRNKQTSTFDYEDRRLQHQILEVSEKCEDTIKFEDNQFASSMDQNKQTIVSTNDESVNGQVDANVKDLTLVSHLSKAAIEIEDSDTKSQISPQNLQVINNFSTQNSIDQARVKPPASQSLQPNSPNLYNSPNLANNPELVNSPKSDSADQRSISQTAIISKDISFEMMGVKFKNWILLLDTVHLQQQSHLQLWDNIALHLHLNPQYLNFPICTGISDIESAEASIAGFVFGLAKSEKVNVGILSPMPDNINMQAISQTGCVKLPFLNEMIENSQKKREFWQRLSS